MSVYRYQYRVGSDNPLRMAQVGHAEQGDNDIRDRGGWWAAGGMNQAGPGAERG